MEGVVVVCGDGCGRVRFYQARLRFFFPESRHRAERRRVPSFRFVVAPSSSTTAPNPSLLLLEFTTSTRSYITKMAHSMSEACTPLKHAYDACFNAWFEGYLRPAISESNSTPEQRAAYSKQKADEYEAKCGKIWREYKDCVQVRSVRVSCLS